MKNYLFAPFKDDEEKITHFNYLDKNLDHNELILFIGRLESYYDVIINKLQSEHEELKAECSTWNNEEVKALKKEIKTLKQNNHYKKNLTLEIEGLKADNDKLIDKVNKLQGIINEDDADYNSLDGQFNKLENENARLKDELQAVNDNYNNDHKVHNEYADGLLAEIKELQAEVKEKEKQ